MARDAKEKVEDDLIGLLGDARIYEGPRRRSLFLRPIGFLAEWSMPKVGKKEFPYTSKGKKAAMKEEGKMKSKREVMKRLKKGR